MEHELKSQVTKLPVIGGVYSDVSLDHAIVPEPGLDDIHSCNKHSPSFLRLTIARRADRTPDTGNNRCQADKSDGARIVENCSCILNMSPCKSWRQSALGLEYQSASHLTSPI